MCATLLPNEEHIEWNFEMPEGYLAGINVSVNNHKREFRTELIKSGMKKETFDPAKRSKL